MKTTGQPRLTGEARTAKALDLQVKYLAGSSIRSLADHTGYSYGLVHKLLLEAKTPLRSRGGARPRPLPANYVPGGYVRGGLGL